MVQIGVIVLELKVGQAFGTTALGINPTWRVDFDNHATHFFGEAVKSAHVQLD